MFLVRTLLCPLELDGHVVDTRSMEYLQVARTKFTHLEYDTVLIKVLQQNLFKGFPVIFDIITLEGT